MKILKVITLILGSIPLLVKSQATDTLKPTFKFENTVHDFGNINEGQQVTCEFTCTNISKTPLIISSVGVTCSCMTPAWSKEPIAPGKTAQIRITYDSKAKPGHFTKVSYVKFASGDFEYLTIRGIVDVPAISDR